MGHAALWCVTAAILAVLSGAFLGEGAYQYLQRKSLAAAMLAPSRRDRLVLGLQGGFAPLTGAAKWIEGSVPLIADVAGEASILLEERGLSVGSTAIVSWLMLAACASAVVMFAATLSPVFAIATSCIVVIGFTVYVRNRSEKANLAMREEIPEALRSLSMSFRSGHSLLQTLNDTSHDIGGYLGRLFAVSAKRLQMGETPTEALSIMRGNMRAPELSFVAVALDVQHQTGGSIAPVLEAATESVEGELRLTRSLRVQTAQAKLSASIVTIMPFILVALFSLMSPDFLSPFFESFIGMGVLALALVMQFTGILIVRHMLKVDVG